MKQRRKVDKDRWYVVDLRGKKRLGFFPLFRVSFKTKKRAQQAVLRNFEPDERLSVEVVSGKEAIEYGMSFRKRKKSRWHKKKIIKYDYPPDKLTEQEKKSFRTKYRRWKKQMKKELNKYWA